MYGKRHSEQTKSQIKKHHVDMAGDKHPLYGKKHSLITRAKMSKNHCDVNGSKNHNWCGGKSFELYSKLFNKKLKNKILCRDNYICQECGVKSSGKKLAIHHIDYNKKNNNIYNLVPLCDVCHSRTNGNRRFWIKEFELLLFARKFCMTLGLECEP
jgi:hypothetical protein